MSSDSGKPWSDRREVRTKATPEQAWSAWADPRIVQGWFADEAEGEAKPGGAIVHHFRAFNLSYPMEVIESEPGRRLLFRMSFPGRPPVTQEIVIRKDGGETVIEMTNSGFGSEDWEGQWEGIDSGWKMSLAQLRHYLEHHYGRRRATYFAMRPASFARERLARAYAEVSQLSRWFAEPGSANGAAALASAGVHVALHVRGAGPLTGKVLATTGIETLLSWQEQQGALELKAFEMGPGNRVVGLRMSSWSEHPPSQEATVAWMREALDRLAPLVA
jgi:uncharacterized protein YndB with AHSA1/START domain